MVKSLEVHVLCLGRPSQVSSYETRGNEVIKKNRRINWNREGGEGEGSRLQK